jgi:hypothetical protein
MIEMVGGVAAVGVLICLSWLVSLVMLLLLVGFLDWWRSKARTPWYLQYGCFNRPSYREQALMFFRGKDIGMSDMPGFRVLAYAYFVLLLAVWILPLLLIWKALRAL